MATKQTAIQKAKKSRNVIIATQAATGQDVKTIASQNNLSERQTFRILKDEQCKAILDHVMRVNIAHAKGINKQFLKLCYDPDKKIKLDAIKQYQKNIGITPTHTQSVHIQNIFNQTNIGAITPEALEYMHYLKGKNAGPEADVIDVMP